MTRRMTSSHNGEEGNCTVGTTISLDLTMWLPEMLSQTSLGGHASSKTATRTAQPTTYNFTLAVSGAQGYTYRRDFQLPRETAVQDRKEHRCWACCLTGRGRRTGMRRGSGGSGQRMGPGTRTTASVLHQPGGGHRTGRAIGAVGHRPGIG
jgi:hypothetical protein